MPWVAACQRCAEAHPTPTPPHDSLHVAAFEFFKRRRGAVGAVADAHPIVPIKPALDPFVKRRVRPRMRAMSDGVLHRVVMDVVNVTAEILLVTDQMLMKPPLPNAASPGVLARFAHRLFAAKGEPGRMSPVGSLRNLASVCSERLQG